MNEALISQRSAENWPFANLDGVCKTKTLEGELTEGSTENPDDENVCDYVYDEEYRHIYEYSGCSGTTFREKGNFI